MAVNKWDQPEAPPPRLFTGKRERDFVKQVNDEVIERIVGQEILYFAISQDETNYHPLYGEAIEKTFFPPIQIYALVEWESTETDANGYGIDRKNSIIVKFNKRRLIEDRDLFVREGDFVKYGSNYYEIVKINEGPGLFGQVENKNEVVARCIRARQGLFDAT